jgi:hypothetical protein
MTKHRRFAVCIRNTGYLASLELRKLYEVIDDADAENDSLLRVVDESGEDYLFPADMFAVVDLPSSVEEAVVHAGEIAG